MKRVLLILTMVIACFLLASCEKETMLVVNVSSLSFDNNGGSQPINIVANKAWSASSTQGWCKVSPFSGDGSDNSNFTLSVSCDANATYDERSCTITIVCEELTSTITVTQAEGKGLFLSQTEYNLTNEAQTITLEVQSNIQYSVLIDDACKSWIKQESTKGLSSNTIKFAISKNESYDGREGKITIKQTDGSLSGTVVVKQNQQNGLFVTTSEYNLSNEKHTLTVEVKANVEFDVKSNADWIKYVETKGLKTSQIVLDVAANEDYDGREGTVTVKQKNGDLEGVITIRQEQNYGLFVSQSEFDLSSAEQTIEVEVKYNVSFYEVIPDDCRDWISVINTKGLSSRYYTIAIAKNETYDNREGSITFKQIEGSLSGTITIKQSQKDGIIAEEDYSISLDEQQLDIKVKSNTLYDVLIDDSCKDWISRIQTKGLVEETLSFHISKNKGDERQGKVILKSESLQTAIKVTQGGAVQFDDINFETYCLEHFDYNNDGLVSYTEAASANSIECDNANIKSLKGIEHFTHLEKISCIGNQLTSLDVSKNTDIKQLLCGNNQLTSLVFGENKSLVLLYCGMNQLYELDVTNCTALEQLICYENKIKRLDVSKNGKLKSLFCGSNQLSGLDVSDNSELTVLECSENSITSLDVSHNGKLTELECSYLSLNTLNISRNTALESIVCRNNKLSSLDVSKNTKLTTLVCSDNNLSYLDISTNTFLETLWCDGNQLPSLDVSYNKKLIELLCDDNRITNLDVSNNSLLQTLWCKSNLLTTLDISNNAFLTSLVCNDNPYLKDIWIRTTQSFTDFNYDADIATVYYVDAVISFKDAKFKEYCVANFDADGDGEVSYLEARGINTIAIESEEIESLQGIEGFPNLAYLRCVPHYTLRVFRPTGEGYLCFDGFENKVEGKLKELDVSHNTKLKSIECQGNQLTKLDVSNCSQLRWLDCAINPITTLDITKCEELEACDISHTAIQSIDFSKNLKLQVIDSYCNLFEKLDISGLPRVHTVTCNFSKLKVLNTKDANALKQLYCTYNEFTVLDVSTNQNLEEFNCKNNPYLKEIWLKTNQTIPNFQYDTEVATIKYIDESDTIDESEYAKYIVGSWKVDKVEYYVNGKLEDTYDENLDYYYVFTNNGYAYTSNAPNDKVRYSISGNKLTLNGEVGYIRMMTKTKMELEDRGYGDKEVTYLTKIK